MAKRLTRKTKGYNAQVFVAKAINITDDATLAAFVANAPLGEFGVFDADGNKHTDLIAATEQFFFAVKTTEGIKRTQLFKLAECSIYKKLYTAPVKQVSGVGWYGTGGALNGPVLAVGQTYGLKLIETTEGFDPYPTWNYEYTTKSGDVELDIMQNLAKKLNDPDSVENKTYGQLVTAKVKSDATYGNFTMGGTTPILTVTNGSAIVQIESGANDGTIDAVVGDFISFDASATPTDSVGDIYKIIAKGAGNDAQITLNRIYTGATQTFTAAEANGTRVKKVTSIVKTGLELTAKDNGVHFRLAVTDDAENADLTYITAFNPGNGTYEQVVAIEDEGKVFAGKGGARNVAFSEKFDSQDSFAVSGETYDFYHFNAIKTVAGIGHETQHSGRSNVVIAVARSGGDVDGSLNTLFAL